MKLKLFISYAHCDEEKVTESIIELLSAAGYDVWYDSHLFVGENWEEQLSKEIANSDAFVYALTSSSVKSEYCQWEFQRAEKLKKPTFPIILEKDLDIPFRLRKIQHVDFSDGTDGKQVAKLLKGLAKVSQRPQIPLSSIIIFISLIVIGILVLILSLLVNSQNTSSLQANKSPDMETNQILLSESTEVLIQGTVDVIKTRNAEFKVKSTKWASTLSYPCEAKIVSENNELISQIYRKPSADSEFSKPVLSDTSVNIYQDISESGTRWYLIAYNNNKDGGWIMSQWLQLSNDCIN